MSILPGDAGADLLAAAVLVGEKSWQAGQAHHQAVKPVAGQGAQMVAPERMPQ